MSGSITDVAGVRVGHFSDPQSGTGLTVAVFPEGSRGSVDVRGGAPGTRETDLLRPENTVERIDALLFSGGSAFGLDAAAGIMQRMSAEGRGFSLAKAVVPIVPAAVIFDEGAARGHAPTADDAIRAYDSATPSRCERGRIGAGTGATVGKVAGWEKASPGGLGNASREIGDGVTVAAMAVVNALGDIVDSDGSILAGLDARGGSRDAILGGGGNIPSGASTTLVLVVTDAALTKAQALRVAVMAGDGLARSIRPSHTPFDGDAVFVVSAGDFDADVLRVGTAAAWVVEDAIRDAVRTD